MGSTACTLGRFFPREIRDLAGLAPQRVHEDPHRSSGGSHVLDLPAGDPVIDRAAAHTNELTGLHDRNRLALNHHDLCRNIDLVPLPLPVIGAVSGGL